MFRFLCLLIKLYRGTVNQILSVSLFITPYANIHLVKSFTLDLCNRNIENNALFSQYFENSIFPIYIHVYLYCICVEFQHPTQHHPIVSYIVSHPLISRLLPLLY